MGKNRSTFDILTVLVLTLSVVLAGCYTTQRIHPSELARLDDYKARGEKPEVPSMDGDTFKFHSDVLLSLYLANQTNPLAAEYEGVKVSDTTFTGETDDGERINVPIADIQSVEAEYLDPTRTVLLVVGVTALTLTAGLVIALNTLSVEFQPR